MNWYPSRDYNTRGVYISKVINSDGARLFCDMHPVDFCEYYHSSQNKMNNKRDYRYWNEVLPASGRIVFDIEFKRGDPIYDRICKHYPMIDNEPIGMKKDIEKVIIDALILIGREKEASVLQQEKVSWFSTDAWFKMFSTPVSPFCWMTCCREEKISYHLTLPFVTCVTDEEDYPMSSNTLNIAMKSLYNEMNNIGPQVLPWLQDSYICDPSLLIPHHELRLPGHTKYGEEHVLKIQGNHTILHAISFVQPHWVSENLWYIIPHNEIVCHMNNKVKRQYGIIPDNKVSEIYNMLPKNIRDVYDTYELRKDGISLSSSNGENQVCPVCGTDHSRNRPFISMRDGQYILDCWQWWRVYKQAYNNSIYGPIPIHTYDIDLVRKRQHDILVLNAINAYSLSPYNKITNVNIHEQDIPYIPSTGDVYVRSAMGTGKTKTIISTINESDSHLILSNKIIQAHKYDTLFPHTILYGTNGWMEEDVYKLIVQMESIHKIGNYTYDIVVLDEIETLLRLMISSTMKDKELASLQVLTRAIRNAGRVIVMDAFLKEETIEWIRSMRYSKECKFIQNTYRQIERSGDRELYMVDKKDDIISLIMDDNSKKVIPCLSKNMATSLYQMLMNKGENTLCITGDSDTHIKRMDPHNLWDKYHNIIYTSAIANSVSYEKEYFDTLYVIGCRGSAYAEELIQMMGRVRCIKNSKIYAFISNAWYIRSSKNDDDLEEVNSVDILENNMYLPASKKQVYKDMDKLGNAFKGKKYKPSIAIAWDTVNSHTTSFFARILSDRGLDQRCFKSIFIHIMREYMGWKIVENYKPVVEKVEMKKVKSVSKKDREVYDTYVDDKYTRRDEVYDNYWRKSRKNSIMNMIHMKRRTRDTPDTEMKHKYIDMYTDVRRLFMSGGVDINKCIENKSKSIVLKYVSSSSINELEDDVLIRLAAYYGISLDLHHKWGWIHAFLVHDMFMKCDRKMKNTNNIRTYTYTIDLTDWLWYHIKE